MTLSLFISASLYPSDIRPQMGLFVEKRLCILRDSLPADTIFDIYSPVPFFPFSHKIFGHYADYATIPHIQHRHEFEIKYPRHLHIPLTRHRFTMDFVADCLEKNLRANIQKYQKKPDILIAEYGFPDGLALAKLGRKYNIPVIFTARGSDISYFPKLPAVKKNIADYKENISGIICVSHDMKQDILNLGFDENKVTVIGNGVDTTLFMPCDDTAYIREKYGIKTKYIISSVGGLIPRKGHDLSIQALSYIPDTSLIIAGQGDALESLKSLVKSLSLHDRVYFVGQKTHAELSEIYSMSDVFLLSSLSEGRANVLLEAAACGCPLVSSNVQGTSEIITHHLIGQIFTQRDPEQLAYVIKNILYNYYDRKKIRNHTFRFSWAQTGKNYADFLFSVRDKYVKSL